MKALLLIPIILLAGCSQPAQLSQSEADAIKACLEKGWNPTFAATTSRRDFECAKPNEK